MQLYEVTSSGYPTPKSDPTSNPARASQRGAASQSGSGKELSNQEKREVENLKQRDQQVRNHEQAHMAAGGGLAGPASYTYRIGPDGQRYAVGGEVNIDVSPEKDPRATIQKMERIERAAMAPADPSGQDFAVAREAEQVAQQARRELSAKGSKLNVMA